MITWYRFLNKRVRFESKKLALVSRVGLDQLLFAPTFTAVFFTYNGLMDGDSFDKIYKRLQKGYFTALKANYAVWPAVQLINFGFVPLNYQTVVVNTLALGWNTYMNILNQKSKSD